MELVEVALLEFFEEQKIEYTVRQEKDFKLFEAVPVLKYFVRKVLIFKHDFLNLKRVRISQSSCTVATSTISTGSTSPCIDANTDLIIDFKSVSAHMRAYLTPYGIEAP